MRKLKGLHEITQEWINSIPKTINSNGCWIPKCHSRTHGYASLSINKSGYFLHRIVMCFYNKISYFNQDIETRHGKGCSRSCFFHEHLKPGSKSDNVKDSVLHKTHRHTQKEFCPRCGGKYVTYITKSGWSKGQVRRKCPTCNNRKKPSST